MALRVLQDGTNQPLALKADLLGNALRSEVPRIGRQIKPLESELVDVTSLILSTLSPIDPTTRPASTTANW